jgi:hypothetical protein
VADVDGEREAVPGRGGQLVDEAVRADEDAAGAVDVCDANDAAYLEVIDFISGTRFAAAAADGVWLQFRIICSVGLFIAVFRACSQSDADEARRQAAALAGVIRPYVKVVYLGRSPSFFGAASLSDAVCMLMGDALQPPGARVIRVPDAPTWNIPAAQGDP